MTTTPRPKYGQRYEEALSYAARLHSTQWRKSDPGGPESIPYVAHLLEVSALVWSGGGDEDEAIAALLHDALEDQYDQTSTDELTARFGARVTELVIACTDGATGAARDASTWLERKVDYVIHLWAGDRSALLVTAATRSPTRERWSTTTPM